MDLVQQSRNGLAQEIGKEVIEHPNGFRKMNNEMNGIKKNNGFTNGASNGHSNGPTYGKGHANGHANGTSNGHSDGTPNGIGHTNGHTNGALNGHSTGRTNGKGHTNGHTNGPSNGHSNGPTNGVNHTNGHTNGASNGQFNGPTNGNGHTNGQTNGKSNGHTNGTSNGHANGVVNEALDSISRYEMLIGDTPIVDLTRLCNPKVTGVRVLGKCEFLNPGFSMKDRIIKNILDKAEQNGQLKAGGTVVAASSGNTGAAVAMLCGMRGYKAVITTSTKCSHEKMDTIRAYGAKLIVSPPGVPEAHPDSYMNMARTLARENEGWFDVNQYDNMDNPEGHYRTLGPEIWKQTGGAVTHFVAGGSTGGTISGTGRFLKAQNPETRCILADPMGSSFYGHYQKRKHIAVSDAERKPFLVEGVGKDSVPGCLDFSVVDDVIRVKDEDSFRMCHELARKEGLMVGGSAGLNTFAAIELANSMDTPAVIVTVLCDLGIKYLSKVYNEKWLQTNHINVD